MHVVMSARGGKGENIEARGGPCFSRQFAQRDINQKRGRGSMRSANFPRQNIVYMHTAFRENSPKQSPGSLFLFPTARSVRLPKCSADGKTIYFKIFTLYKE